MNWHSSSIKCNISAESIDPQKIYNKGVPMSSLMLKIEKSEGIAILTLNSPEKMNALSYELRQTLVEAFRELQADENIRVVILTGSGRAFCAGLDLKELVTASPDGSKFADDKNVLPDAIRAFDRPIIGAINGHAITGGFELALLCDILIASNEAKFADTHVRFGMLSGWGLSQLLPRLIGKSRAKEISFTGNFITAEKAEAWGLVNRIVPANELLSTCRALAEDIASCDVATVKSCKRLIDEGYGMNLDDALAHESAAVLDWNQRITSDEIAAARRDLQNRGHQQDCI